MTVTADASLDATGGVPVADAGASPGSLVSQAGQVQYGQLLLGVGSAAGWRELVGWRMLPEAELSDSNRPQAHGVYPGDVYGGALVVTFTYLLRGTPAGKLAALDAIEQHTRMDGVERPLVVDDGSGPWQRMARVIARDVPQGMHFSHAPLECSVQWLCADPRRYGLQTVDLSLDLPASSGGLQYPLDYATGLEYGTYTAGSVSVLNRGSEATPVRLTFYGPLEDPVLTTSDWTLGFRLSLAAGESLVVDTYEGSVLLNGTTDRLYTITNDSDPIERCLLKPGTTDMALSAPNGSGRLGVSFRYARM